MPKNNTKKNSIELQENNNNRELQENMSERTWISKELQENNSERENSNPQRTPREQ